MKAFSALLLVVLLAGQLSAAAQAHSVQPDLLATNAAISAAESHISSRAFTTQSDRNQVFPPIQQPANRQASPATNMLAATSPSCLDFNGNHEVDAADIQAVAGHWRQRSSDSLWDSQFDLDGNNTINIVDIMRVSAAWPSVCPAPVPEIVAPALDQTVVTNLVAATEFLYTGNNPIQTGVSPGTIAPTRVAVVRGKVTTRDEQPLSGVAITILDHPEFGQTLSRADGMFDMAVNGGGLLTVNYSKTGFLPAQRQVQSLWQEYAAVDNVALVPLDSNVATIDLAANVPMQVAQGSVSTDSDGTRRATLLFPQGTQAEMVLPNGTTQPLTTLHVRATEYTVGTGGRAAMPGSLPPQSGYTYAAEFSVDEALAAGATGVRFTQPIVSYVDNFLGFAVGTPVPAGYYDMKLGVWIPLDDGRVIKVLSITAGVANLDTNGDGASDDGATLAALGVSDAERQQIARLFQPGQSFWRTLISHFSTIDYNWPYGCKVDANGASLCPEPPPAKPLGGNDTSNPSCRAGSIIECQNQTLREAVDVVGTPFTLHYRSDRVPGRLAGRSLSIPLSAATLPNDLKRIDLEIEVAGRFFRESFAPAPNLSYDFLWDGLDAYERPMVGEQPATVRVGYVYGAVYYSTAAGARRSFGTSSGRPGSSGISGNAARIEITRWKIYKGSVTHWNSANHGLAGWSLDVHHLYDPIGRTLYLGSGERYRAETMNRIITTVVGGGSLTDAEGSPALEASIHPNYVFVASDGSFYFDSNNRVRRVDPDGRIFTVAGGGNPSDGLGDGLPATQARLGQLPNPIIAADGAIIITDPYNHRIRRIGADGIITTIAGTGTPGYSGDGGPAVAAQLYYPYGIALAPDGSLVIGDTHNQRIRRISTDGVITTIAGTGVVGYNGDNIPALEAQFEEPADIAFGPDGSLYIADWQRGFSRNRIRRVGIDGIITTVAGLACDWRCPLGDGGPATSAPVDGLARIAIGADGSIYLSQQGYEPRVRRISPDGVINTIAGNGSQGNFGYGNNGPATSAKFSGGGMGLAIDAGGNIFVADGIFYDGQRQFNGQRIRKISPFLPGFSADDLIIPSSDGTELYAFDPAGRHLRTVNAQTGVVIYRFGSDQAGRLISIEDADGNVTQIQRDAAGRLTSVRSPDGQITSLEANSAGYLSRIVNPAGEVIALEYSAGGLLTLMVDPRGGTHHFTYDPQGRLLTDENPGGGTLTLSRSILHADTPEAPVIGYQVGIATTLGRQTTYRVENLPTDDQLRTTTFPDGTALQTRFGDDGSRSDIAADGMVTTQQEGPDPRWGMQAPFVSALTTTTPGGLSASITTARTVDLADPSNLLSLTKATDTVTINGRTYSSVYNAASRTFTNSTPEGRQATVATDTQGRPLQAQVAGLEPARYTYDSRGRLATIAQGTSTSARTTTFSYNSSGQLATITDPIVRIVRFTYDVAGRVTRQTLPDGREIGYAYDANGNLTAITPPGRPAHSFTYTPADLQASYIPPIVGSGSSQTQYSYNPEKQLTRVTRPDGQTVDLGYDSPGRLSTLTTARGVTIYGYQPTTGNLATISAPGGVTLSYSYDGALLTNETWAGPVVGGVGQTYDNNFRVTSTSVNGGNTIAFQYDRDSLLTQAGALTLARNPQNGLLTSSALGDIADTWGYNPFGEPASYSAAYAGTDAFVVQYVRDDLGRISAKTETIGGVSATYGYTYDQAGRLTQVRKDGATTATYTYDSNGNRLSYTGPGGTLNGSYDAQDRLTQYGATAYAYTANGELLNKTTGAQTTTYQYDALGNLFAAGLPSGTQLGYLVDGRNRRVGKQVNGALVQGFLYENQLNPIAELDGTGNIVSRFVYASRANVPDYMVKGGATYRIIADHLGSPRLVVDTATGAIAQRMDYDEFGNITLDTAPGFQPFGFAGGLYDRDTQLTRFGARDYDAETGRWTAKDPIGFAGGDSNLYGYVVSDPINLVDPGGNCPECSDSSTNRGEDIAEQALNQVDKPYIDGANGSNAYDCSGLVVYCANLQVDRSVSGLWDDTDRIELSEAQSGDLVFFDNNGHGINHVGILVSRDKNGNWAMVHASSNKKKMQVEKVDHFLQQKYYKERYRGLGRLRCLVK